MTLNKAIKINTVLSKIVFIDKSPDRKAATKLGIAALIRERNNRINPGAYQNVPLPGETKE